MEDFLPESLGKKHACASYAGVHYTWQNMAYYLLDRAWRYKTLQL